MRRLILICALAISILMCTSCLSDAKQFTDSVYFITTNVGDDIGLHGSSLSIPIKINPITKTSTTVCLDPLCSNSVLECPLGTARMRAVSGNYLFFVSASIGDSDSHSAPRRLSVYDMIEGNYTTLATYDNYPIFIATYEEWLYYYEISSIEGSTNEGYYAAGRLCRVNGESKRIEYLSDSTEYNSSYSFTYENLPQIIGFDDNKILWRYLGENEHGYEFYLTDHKNKNKRVLQSNTDGIKTNASYSNGYLFYTQQIDNMSSNSDTKYQREKQARENILYSMNIETGEVNTICPYMAEYIIIDDTIYYTVCQDEAIEIAWEMGSEYDWYGGKLYSTNIDDGEQRLIGVIDDINISGFLGAKEIDGVDYLHITFDEWKTNDFYKSGKEYAKSDNTIIFNCSSGEYTIIGWE